MQRPHAWAPQRTRRPRSWCGTEEARPGRRLRRAREPSTPSPRRSKDGENGVATFNFDKPSFFNCEREEDVPQGAITAMTMEDEEGEISTANVSARFVEGKPVGLLVRHEMRTPGEWDRFMRFMERYAEANGLGFAKA